MSMMFRSIGYLVLSISSVAIVHSQTTSNQGDPECDFKCFNNSTCAWGVQDTTGHPDGLKFHTEELSRDNKHCACKPGFTGLRCAKEYVSCYDNDHKCYHGGQCIPGLNDEYGNHQYFCDCSKAKDDQNNRYAGKYCENQAIDVCDTDGSLFCVNGGTCKDNAKDHPHVPCWCDDDYEGPHCEFKKGTVPECNLQCESGGKCRLGIKNYALALLGVQSQWESSINSMYCDCHEGYFGVRCEIQSVKCGEHYCFNGATCESTPDGPECDCTKAHNHQHSFAGRYCQYQASTFCEKGTDIDGQDFCVNGGTCREDGSVGCQCKNGWTGPKCEHRSSEGAVTHTCNLKCENGGVCTKGKKDLSWLDKVQDGQHIKSLASNSNVFEHCKCPDGFTGLNCENKVETCGAGDNAHVCFFGGKCTINMDGTTGCDCSFASGNTKFDKYEGLFCEHKVSTFCTKDGQPGPDHHFCVNEGKCKSISDGTDSPDHGGCDCPEEYKGEHCQFHISATTGAAALVKLNEPTAERSSKSIGVFLGVFFTIVVIVAGAVLWWKKSSIPFLNKDKEMDSASVNTGTSSEQNIAPVATKGDESNSQTMLDMGPDKDMEGNELSNVEII